MKISKTLKKLLAAGAIAVLAAGIFTGCGSTSSTQDDKKIVVGTNLRMKKLLTMMVLILNLSGKLGNASIRMWN